MKSVLMTGSAVTLMLCSLMAAAGDGPCLARGPYFGQGSAPATPKLFAPGFASTQHHDDWPPIFSPDGREVMLRILGKVDGEIVGILFSSQMDDDGCWSTPRPLPFSGLHSDGAITYASGGSRVFFTSKRPTGDRGTEEPRSRIWFSDRTPGGWSEPVLLDSPINQFNINGGISMADNGTIYAATEAPGGLGRLDIYVLRPIDGRYPGLEPIPGSVNTEGLEGAPYIDPDQRFLLSTVLGDEGVSVVLSLPNENGGWSKGEPIPVLADSQSKFGAISRDGSVMFFVSHLQHDESNPHAPWAVGLFEEPALDANADLYWVSADEVLVAQ
jgi:hypothetical protein